MKVAAFTMLGLTLAVGGCVGAARPGTPAVPNTPLIAAGGPTLDARQLIAGAPFTVLVFFSRGCHCLEQHDGRLRDLYAAYHPRGVQVAMIDSEVRATPELDAAEAARRGYPFPLLIDRGARLADALDAQYATYSVIVNAEGHVLYRGGIDSDKTHLRESSTPYLRDALDDLLAGRAPRIAEAKTLGCSLEKW
jgi:hypothetical protein